MAYTNTSLSDTFALAFTGSSCPPSPNAVNAVDRLQQSLESLDLSVTVPDHPELSLFGYSIESNVISGKYAVDLPNIQTVIGFMFGGSAAYLIGVTFATIIYHTFIKETKRSAYRNLIGTALLITTFLSPYALISGLGVENTSTRFTICILFVLNLFRTLEAIFGFIPTGAKASWGIYCTYFILPFDMKFDPVSSKPIMARKGDILKSQIHLIKTVSYFIVYCSLLFPYGGKPFGETSAGEFHERIVFSDYLDARHLGNCFAIALFFQQALSVADAAIGNGVQILLGYKADIMMRNPMLEATSPSDFWGRRWNILVHVVLKRAVYKPVRKYSSSLVASLAVFVASGLFHEWIVHAVFIYKRPEIKK